MIEELKALAEKATPGPWRVIDYDCGDCDYYDHNGPCPSIQASDEQDCAIVHWDGFKQQYWSAANGNQQQIEANAALIVALVNNLPAILSALSAVPVAKEALGEAIDVFDGMCDDEINEELLPRLRQALAALEPKP